MSSSLTRRASSFGLLICFLLACARPEVLSPKQSGATFARAVVAADSATASEVGARVLADGGDAVDAAIATALALGVVHPHSSGLGGGGFMMVYRAKEKKTYVLDFREVAPKAIAESLYLEDGKVKTERAQRGGLAVGVPGEIAGFYEAQLRWGKRPWKSLFVGATTLARDGFVVDMPLSVAIKQVHATADALTQKELTNDLGEARQEGSVWKRPALAASLALLAREPRAMYKGSLAKEIVAATHASGGVLLEDDLAEYQVKWREPLVADFQGYTVLSMPPPSSGGIVVIEVLNILEKFSLREMPYVTYLSFFAEALQHAFADRARSMGDPDFVKIPLEELTSQAYADKIAAKIDGKNKPIEQYGREAIVANDGGTTHLSVIDKEGNAVALTSTVNLYFGSQLVVGGFFLNNEMDDFSLQKAANSFGLVGSAANQVAPGKRPLSSMSPTFVFKDESLRWVLGGSGGPRIITGVLQTLLNLLVFGMEPAEAVAAPRVHHQWLPAEFAVESTIDKETRAALEGQGYVIKVLPEGYAGAVGIVQLAGEQLGKRVGVSDPRKGGAPAGY